MNLSEWQRRPTISDKDVHEALDAAHKALTEIARTKGLDPDGERARDLCADALNGLGRGQRRARGVSR